MYPADPLDIFEAICTPARDLERVRRAASAGGWRAFVPGSGSPIGSLLKLGRAATADRNMTFEVLRHAGCGEALAIMLVRAQIDRSWANGCRLYGMTIGSAPSQADIIERIGRKPTAFSEELGAKTVTWEPGWSAGDDSLELILAPRTSEAAYVTGFSGWALIAQAVSAPHAAV